MLDFIFEESGAIAGIAVILVVVIMLILLVLFLENVPKHLKGIEAQLQRMNDLAETQARNQKMNDSMKNIVKDAVREIRDEKKSGKEEP